MQQKIDMMNVKDYNRAYFFGMGGSYIHAHKVLSALYPHLKMAGWDDSAKVRDKYSSCIEMVELFEFTPSDLLIMTPGADNQVLVKKAEQAGARVTCDVELFMQMMRPFARCFTVTGSNGKSTTSLVLAQLLRSLGLRTGLGGNISPPCFSLLYDTNKSIISKDDVSLHAFDCLVIETSSFQLEYSRAIHAHIAILTDMFPCHLDRHKTYQAYSECKKAAFRPVPELCVTVGDNHRNVQFQQQLQDCNWICLNGGGDVRIDERGNLVEGQNVLLHAHSPYVVITGPHDLRNIGLAYLAAVDRGFKGADLAEAVKNISAPMQHRMNLVARHGAIDIINNSKATNMFAMRVSIEAVTGKPIFLIAGGEQDLIEQDMEPICDEELCKKVKRVLLCGSNKDFMHRHLANYYDIRMCQDLESALQLALKEAGEEPQGATILFAPGCNSYGQFGSFIQRGEAFVELVKNLINQG